MKKLLVFVLLIVGCNLLKEEDVYGCTDSTACNFNVYANISDGCDYIVDECGICGSNSSGICSPFVHAPLSLLYADLPIAIIFTLFIPSSKRSAYRSFRSPNRETHRPQF